MFIDGGTDPNELSYKQREQKKKKKKRKERKKERNVGFQNVATFCQFLATLCCPEYFLKSWI